MKSLILGLWEYLRSPRSFGSVPRSLLSAAVLAAWLTAAILVTAHHELGRDEVRALSVALVPQFIWELPATLRNEGHPILWYLVLRATFVLTQTPAALKIASITVAFCGVVFFVVRAPLATGLKLLFIWGVVPFYEYAVVARNYGISMLFFFLYAALHRDRCAKPLLTGLVLGLLANTNAASCLFAGALAGLWLVEDFVLGRCGPVGRRGRWGSLAGLTLAAAGIAGAALVMLPDRNTVVTGVGSLGVPQVLAAVWEQMRRPAQPLGDLFAPYLGSVRGLMFWAFVGGLLVQPLAALALYLGTVLLGNFFAVVFPGELRHQGVFLVYLLTLYWIVQEQDHAAILRAVFRAAPAATAHENGHCEEQGDEAIPALREGRRLLRSAPQKRRCSARNDARMAIFGAAGSLIMRVLRVLNRVVLPVALGVLLITQLVPTWRQARFDVRYPKSSSQALATLIQGTPAYREAILMGEPDYLLEPLPYYVPNRVYIPREGVFRNYVSFTTASRPTLSLGELLDAAQMVGRREGKPVLIVLGHRELSGRSDFEIRYSYNKLFIWSPGELAAFLAATEHVATFDAARSDENYEVYLLKTADGF